MDVFRKLEREEYCFVRERLGLTRAMHAIPFPFSGVKMDRIDTSSYYKTETVSRTKPMTEVGKMTVGEQVHYDQRLGYSYREIEQGSNVCFKQYKKVVLMDEVLLIL